MRLDTLGGLKQPLNKSMIAPKQTGIARSVVRLKEPMAYGVWHKQC
jgi:hypothetical protein